jgi:archaeal preflagellin peptidase FlaK
MFSPGFPWLFATRTVVLLGGLGFAAYQDWKIREVADGLWQGMGLLGAAAGVVAFWGNLLDLSLWILVSAWMLEHLFSWDLPLERISARLPSLIEILFYVAALGILIATSLDLGVGGAGVPSEVLAVAATILLARGLFEIGILYGGADAKALMVAGLLLPIVSMPLWSPTVATGLLAYYPFALTILINAALFAVVVPIAIALRNISAHEFEFPRGFTGYKIPVEELPDHFVWIKDPTFSGPSSEEGPEPETTEEDRALRQRQAQELEKQGVKRVWVTPQLPFILWILAGTVAALVAGNVVFDLLTGL